MTDRERMSDERLASIEAYFVNRSRYGISFTAATNALELANEVRGLKAEVREKDEWLKASVDRIEELEDTTSVCDAATLKHTSGGTQNMSFRVVLADPAWSYDDKLRMSDVARSADDQYDTMSVQEICGLVEREQFRIADESLLFLWVTNSFLLDGSGTKVARAWGYEPKQLVTWVKTKNGVSEPDSPDDLQFGMGRITRGVTEHIIVGTRGKYSRLIKAKNIRNVLFAPRREHSRKPDEQYAMIEGLVDGPYLELFARRRRDGWVSWGNQIAA